MPASFPDRGGNAQLVWGLLVCFLTFGAYMMWAPFLNYSDDQLQQLSQFQIFLTLVASIGLRMTPPSYTLATMMSILMLCLPVIALLLETPLVSELSGGWGMLRKACQRLGGTTSKKVSPDVASSSTDLKTTGTPGSKDGSSFKIEDDIKEEDVPTP